MTVRILFGLVILSVGASLPTKQVGKSSLKCKPLDIVLLLDSTRSVSFSNFRTQRKFVGQYVSQLSVGYGELDTRVGLLRYANSYWLSFYLRTYHTQKKLQHAIKYVPHKMGPSTQISNALNFMRKYMFSEKLGARKNSSRVAIVITDGMSQNIAATRNAAEAARKAGIEIFVIGVGTFLYKKELYEIGSNPKESHVIVVKEFLQLSSVLDKLPKSACVEQVGTTTTSFAPSSSTTGYIPDSSSTTGYNPDRSSTTGYIPDSSSTTGYIPDSSSTTGYIPDSSSTTGNIPDSSSTSGYIPDSSSTTGYNPDRSSTTGYIPDSSSTTGYIPDSSSTTGYIPDRSSTTGYIPDSSSTTGYIPDSSSTTGYIPDRSSTTGYIPDSSSTTGYIPDRSSTTGYIPDSSSTTGNIPDSSSTTGYIPDSSSTTGYIPDSSSTTWYIPDSSSTTRYIPDSSSTTGYIPDSSTTARHVSYRSSTTGHVPESSSTTGYNPEKSSTTEYVPDGSSTKMAAYVQLSTRKPVVNSPSAKSKLSVAKDEYKLTKLAKKKKKMKSINSVVNDRPLVGPQDVVFNDDPTDYCGEKDADIYFVLDSSTSIWYIDFKKQLKFVNDMIDEFNIDNSNGRFRIGVITYSASIKNIVGLNSKRNKDELKQQVRQIDYMSGITNTSDAIKFVREYGFRRSVTRDSAVKIAIIMTDGISRDPAETARESELARQENIHLFAIGIGSRVDKSELEKIANDPDNKHLFHVSSYDALDTIKDILTFSACAVIPDQPSNLMTCDPNSKAEIVFIYDAFALGFRKTQMIGNMVFGAVSKLNLTSGNIMVGRLTDNCPSATNIQLGSAYDATKFAMLDFPGISRMLMSLPYTFTGLPGVKRLGVLIVDESTQGISEAREFMKRNNDFELMVIAIGERKNLGFAEDLASEPDINYLINFQKYSNLTTSFGKIVDKLCGIIKPIKYPYVPLGK